MDIDVSPKPARRRGVTKEHIQHGSVTEEQRSRGAGFSETLRAEDLLSWGLNEKKAQRFLQGVYPGWLQLNAERAARKSEKVKNPKKRFANDFSWNVLSDWLLRGRATAGGFRIYRKIPGGVSPRLPRT